MNIFRSNILNVYGERGKEWLNELPQLVNDIAAKLTLTELKPVDNLSFNYVASGFQGKRPVILKAALDTDALKKEALALWCFEDYGAVKVIAEENGFLLLERAIPGISLKSHLPDQTTNSVAIACKMMQRLHQAPIPAEHNFPHIKDWLATLDKDWDMPLAYLQKARHLRDQLLPKHKQQVLLHGDLHHDNILQNQDEWVVIDPKGVIGSPINEIWAFVIDLERDTEFIAQFFGFNLSEVRDWYFVHIILATCWNLEDNIDPSFFLKLAAKALHLTS